MDCYQRSVQKSKGKLVVWFETFGVRLGYQNKKFILEQLMMRLLKCTYFLTRLKEPNFNKKRKEKRHLNFGTKILSIFLFLKLMRNK